MFRPICLSTSVVPLSSITTSLVLVLGLIKSECDVASIKYVVPDERDVMLYYGVFHATVDEKRESPIAVVVTDEDGTVTSYRGKDTCLLLAKAVAEKANIRDVVYGPAQFVLDEIDAPLSPEVNAYIDDLANNAGLRHLVSGLARAEPFLDGGPDWVAFLAYDAYIEAEVKLGMDWPVLRIDAYLLSIDDDKATAQEVQAWIDQQPNPTLGMLSVESREREDGDIEFVPVLSVDAQVDSILADFIENLISPYAEAWEGRTVAAPREQDLGGGDGDGGVYRYRPTEFAPRNAWLLIGSEASYPTPEYLQDEWARAEAGLFDNSWTAPKNGELGDLALIYFVAPRKAACFVARLASGPYWQTDIEVAADKVVNSHQWWAVTTPLVQIEAISYKSLQEAAGGYLPLKGSSGHYLSRQFISQLTFVAKNPEQQGELERIVQMPTGNPELSDPESTTFAEWKAIPGGHFRWRLVCRSTSSSHWRDSPVMPSLGQASILG